MFFFRASAAARVSKQVDADAMGRFLIAAFHGLVLQSEWNEKFEMKPLLDIFSVLLAASTTSGLTSLSISSEILEAIRPERIPSDCRSQDNHQAKFTLVL